MTRERITNRIRHHPGGRMSVHMIRPVGNRSYRYTLWLSEVEQAEGRAYIANRIKRARRDMRAFINEEKGKPWNK